MTCLGMLLSVLVQVESATPVPEPTARDRAQALLREGTALYDADEPAGALAKFEAAYRLFPNPKIWFNIGQAQRDLGNLAAALEAFEKFLAEQTDAPLDAVAEARSQIAELRSRSPAPAPAPLARAPAAPEPVVPVVTVTPASATAETSAPLHRQPWLWATIGGAVLIGVAVGLLARPSGGSDTPTTTLGSQRAFR